MKTILVQAGHLQPYEPGTEGQSGAAGELELNLRNRDALCRLLAKVGRFKVVPMPSKIPSGTKCDAAIFFHADGSGSKSVSGFSFGYPVGPGTGVNKQLADLIAAEYVKLPGHPPHHRDNYTIDEAHYYGFRATDTPGPEVLFEVGFVSNPNEKAWLYAHVDDIAGAVYRALLTYFGMAPKPPPKPKPLPAPKPQRVSGHWLVTVTFHDGQKKEYQVGSTLLWRMKQGNMRKKGIVDVREHWVETA
jgi:N-acetylmuramoyl-L-alanine amidase